MKVVYVESAFPMCEFKIVQDSSRCGVCVVRKAQFTSKKHEFCVKEGVYFLTWWFVATYSFASNQTLHIYCGRSRLESTN